MESFHKDLHGELHVVAGWHDSAPEVFSVARCRRMAWSLKTQLWQERLKGPRKSTSFGTP